MSHTKSSVPAWLDLEDYPFSNHYMSMPAGIMHYVDEGQGDPVVMVHGNPAWSYAYRNVIKTLRRTHRCIAPDHLGFGLSDKPANWDYLPESQAANFEIFMDSLKLNHITMIVNDWGGPIGLNYALKHPEKIKKLIILNTWLWSVNDDPYYRKFSGFMGGPVGKFMIKYFNIFGIMVVKQAFGDKKKLTPKIHAHYYKHLETPEQRKGCYVFPREIIGSGKWLDTLWAQREKICHKPTVFVWGMKDIAFREDILNKWVKNWDNPKVIRLADAGHFPQEESPEVLINEVVNG